MICGIIWSELTTTLFSLLAFILSLFALIGCDYVRLNFASINDENRYFKQPSWFGLGVMNHQNYDEGKNSYIWNHNSTCYNYDDLATDMFKSTNLSGAFNLAIVATVISLIVLFMSAAMICIKQRDWYFFRCTACVLSLVTAILQIAVRFITFNNANGGVCDPVTYGGDSGGGGGWYASYPPFEYSNVRYMRYFSECTAGSTSSIALSSIVFQVMTTLWVIVNITRRVRSSQSASSSSSSSPLDEHKPIKVPTTDDDGPPSTITKDIPKELAFVDDGDAEEGMVQHPPTYTHTDDDGVIKQPLVEKPSIDEKKGTVRDRVRDIEAGVDVGVDGNQEVVPHPESEETDAVISAMTSADVEDIKNDDELEPLTAAVAKEDVIEEVDEEEGVEAEVEAEAEVTQVAEGTDVVAQEEEELEIADKEEDDAEGEEEEEDFSLYTTDVRKEGEATVGNVKIASMKSGRF
jgi:hypothetical protein